MHVNTVHTAALAIMTKPAVVHPGKILPGKLLFSLSICMYVCIYVCMYVCMCVDHLAGLVDKASASGAEGPGFESRLRRDFSGSSHTSDLKIGYDYHYRVRAGTGRPGVSILWLGEVESLICNFYLSVAARKIVCADPSLRYTSMLLGR